MSPIAQTDAGATYADYVALTEASGEFMRRSIQGGAHGALPLRPRKGKRGDR